MCRWRLVLSRLELGTSCTVMRRFGSSMFIRVKVPDKVAHNADSSKLIEYFSHPFVLLGRVFRGYYAKESVFLVQTNEILASSGITSMDWDPSKPGPMPFLAFLDWFNPIELNQNQVLCLSLTRHCMCSHSLIRRCRNGLLVSNLAYPTLSPACVSLRRT
jgi:RNA-dependent RNA polymerase